MPQRIATNTPSIVKPCAKICHAVTNLDHEVVLTWEACVLFVDVVPAAAFDVCMPDAIDVACVVKDGLFAVATLPDDIAFPVAAEVLTPEVLAALAGSDCIAIVPPLPG